MMTPRERFLAACSSEPVDRPPIWIMRQAGRYLPEYRALKLEKTFHEIVKTPELACEVTMQPLRRFALDAAIVFSDILVIPEALGQPYHFRDIGGIEMEFALESDEDVARLDATDIGGKLSYVGDAIRAIRAQMNEELDSERALIGFCGSPWTLATYMIEGQSSKEYKKSRQWFYAERERYDALAQTITDALIGYAEMQIEAGIDAFQIFDSWGGVLPPAAFTEASTSYITKVVEAIDGRVPVVVFSKGMHEHRDALVATGADVLGVTWTADMRAFRDALPANVAVQGNLDPVVLNTTAEISVREARRVLESMEGADGFVFNLGHGIQPQARPENLGAVVDLVTSWGEEGA